MNKVIASFALALTAVGLAGCSTEPSRQEVEDAFFVALIASSDAMTDEVAQNAAETLTELAIDQDACGNVVVENGFSDTPELVAVWNSVCDEYNL